MLIANTQQRCDCRLCRGPPHLCRNNCGGGGTCWGSNLEGELGDGTTIRRTAPAEVEGLSSGVIAVSTGASLTCALTTTGGVKCWGWNKDGQVGDGTTTSRTKPVDVVGLTNGVIAISPGIFQTCALTTVGGLMCWGGNSAGQLGDGTTVQQSTPVDVVGLTSGVAAVSTGFHTCAVTIAGGVMCWGGNSVGQLGNRTTAQRSTPVDVVGFPVVLDG